MAEEQAGQSDAQEQEQQQEQQAQDTVEGGQQQRAAERTYTQAELDRILGKVRKNARYLDRKEAEAELRAQGATPKQAEQAVEREQANAAPKREDFENYEDFLVARARHEAKQASREEREEQAKAEREKTVAEQKQKTQREFRKRAEEVMKEIPDFAETIESAEGVMISKAMGEAIEESAVGPRILYHLVNNPKEAERIAGLSPTAAIREIGKLEAKIEAELAQKGKKNDAGQEEDGEEDEGGEATDEAEDKGPSKRNADGTFKPSKRQAPDPIEPGGARSVNTNPLPSDKDDPDTWLRKRQAQIEREGRA